VFYRTHNTVDQEILIFKPKQQFDSPPEKHKAIEIDQCLKLDDATVKRMFATKARR
jgi:hypothetical protein